MSEWNDAVEAAAKEVHRMLVGVPYFDNARANLLAGIRALKRPEAEAISPKELSTRVQQGEKWQVAPFELRPDCRDPSRCSSAQMCCRGCYVESQP